jgi:fructose-1,6-bisphosphatase I
MWRKIGRYVAPAAQRLLVRPSDSRLPLAAGAAVAVATTVAAYKQNGGAATSCETLKRTTSEDLIANSDSVNASEFPTLTRYILHRTGDYELAVALTGMALACKATSRACAKAGIANLFGMAGEVNSTGDDQKKLDVLSNDIFIDALVNSGACCALVSEENEEPIFVPKDKAGRFVVAFDPLDGSSNIDCNVSTGTIFAIYDRKSAKGTPATMGDILRTGNDIIVAGYCMYGAATELVITFKGRGVHRFTLDPSLGEFMHIESDVKIPKGGGKKIYSCNEGNSLNWDKAITSIITKYKAGDKPYAARYVGSMVSDVHRTILYGGIYLYPADKKNAKGKLRVLYEGFPMAMIVEQAGGAASCGLFNGKIQRLLDIVPKSIHEKCPVVIGSERDVNAVINEYKAQGLA